MLGTVPATTGTAVSAFGAVALGAWRNAATAPATHAATASNVARVTNRLFMTLPPLVQQLAGDPWIMVAPPVDPAAPVHGVADGSASPGVMLDAGRPGVAFGPAVTGLDGVRPVVRPGTMIVGLRPALVVSVAPNGMAPPINVGAVPGGGAGGIDVPFGMSCEALEGQPVSPPPSNMALAPVEQEGGIGLSPPGLSSVAASGVAAVPGINAVCGMTDVPGTPSEEVAPIAGVPPGVCAWAIPEIASRTAKVGRMRRMGPLTCPVLFGGR